MKIEEAPHGINVVLETPGTIYIGRFDNSNGFQVLLHDCAIKQLGEGEDGEAFVKQTAKYGIPVDQRDVMVEAASVQRVRLLGDIEHD